MTEISNYYHCQHLIGPESIVFFGASFIRIFLVLVPLVFLWGRFRRIPGITLNRAEQKNGYFHYCWGEILLVGFLKKNIFLYIKKKVNFPSLHLQHVPGFKVGSSVHLGR